MTPLSLGIFASQLINNLENFDSIATVTVGSGGASDVQFNNIPQGYTHLQIRGIARCNVSGTNQQLQGRFNGDSGSNYASLVLQGNGTSANNLSYSNINVFVCGQIVGSTGLADTFGAAIIDILDYRNTNKNKTVRSFSGHDQFGSGFSYLPSALWMSTSAITSISLFPTTGNSFLQHSSFALYGIKGVA